MAGVMVCEPRHLYNIINQYRWRSRLTEPNYLCLLGEAAAQACPCLALSLPSPVPPPASRFPCLLLLSLLLPLPLPIPVPPPACACPSIPLPVPACPYPFCCFPCLPLSAPIPALAPASPCLLLSPPACPYCPCPCLQPGTVLSLGGYPEPTGLVRESTHITSCHFWGLALGTFLPSHFRCHDLVLAFLTSNSPCSDQSHGYTLSPASPRGVRAGQGFSTITQRFLITPSILHSANTPKRVPDIAMSLNVLVRESASLGVVLGSF